MASEQARRENKVTEREVQVEKDRVPKMTSHFESIAKDSQQGQQQHNEGGESGGTTQTHFVSLSDKGSNMPVSDEGEEESKMKRTQMPQSVGKFVTSSEGTTGKKKEEGQGQQKTSLEDIHGYRANAQQKSMDTIRAAEERYNKAKESLSHGGGTGQEAGKGRESGVRVTHATTDKGQESDVAGRGRTHGGAGAGTVFGQAPGRVGVESAGKGREDRESEIKARHTQLLAAGGAEMKERKGQESAGGGGRSATESAQKAGATAKDTVGEKNLRASDYVSDKGRETGQVASQKGQEAKEQAGRAKDYTMEKAGEAKDTAAEKAQRASQYVTEKGKETGNTAAEKAARAKDFTLQKAVEAKDIAAEKAQRASEYLTEKGKETGNVAAQKGQAAKEQTASMTGKAKDYTVQKAGEVAEYVKEVSVEGGKGAAHYAGVAAEKAAAVGWTAAHFTTEKVVQGTKAVAGTVEGAVGYVGHQAAEVGSKAVDLTKEKAAVAADTVVGYTARKKEEAQHKDQEMHQGGEEEQPGFVTGGKGMAGEGRGGLGEEFGEGRGGEKYEGFTGEPRRDVGEESFGEGGGRRDERYMEEEGAGAGGVLGAIGETIVEIAQTTKNMVIGDEPQRTQEHGTNAPDYIRQEYGNR